MQMTTTEEIMFECDNIDYCRFFLQLLPGIPLTIKLNQNLYCRSNYKRCARYQVAMALGPTAVPDHLSPGDKLWAEMLIEAAQF